MSGGAVIAIAAFSAPALARDIVRVDWTYAETEVTPQQGSYRSAVSTFFILDGRRVTDSNNTTTVPGRSARGTSH